MKRITTILLALAVGVMLVSAAAAKDVGNRDILRLTDVVADNGTFKVAVDVINDEELAALDIPIRFGQPGDGITLESVEWADRVAGWDFTHAAIDNENKTVILGLISELVNVRADADLKTAATASGSKIADLVFRVEDGYKANFETFTTERPGHELTFIYNRYENGKPIVESISPEFDVNASFDNKQTLPTEFALSQNFPNPFNPVTHVQFVIAKDGNASLKIYDALGSEIATYLEGYVKAGKYNAEIDGSNWPSGVYFYKLVSGDYTATKKMILVK
jgi:hypothetical protein